MNIDFTLKIYKKFLETCQSNNYQFLKLEQYLINHPSISKHHITDHSSLSTHHSSLFTHHSSLILRHDVDRLPENALQTAQIEHQLGIQGTYYFRVVPESYDLQTMEKIARLGHEIGYHYEDVDLVLKRKKVMRDDVMGNEVKRINVKRNGVKRKDVMRASHKHLNNSTNQQFNNSTASRITHHPSRTPS